MTRTFEGVVATGALTIGLTTKKCVPVLCGVELVGR